MIEQKVIADALDLTRRGYAKLLTRQNWTQGCNARNKAGQSDDPTSPQATQWCAAGAVLSLHQPGLEHKAAEDYALLSLHRQADVVGGQSGWVIQSINDSRCGRWTPDEAYAAVLACYKGAIAQLEQELATGGLAC